MFVPFYVKKILVKERKIHREIKKAARWINQNYQNKTPILLGVLKGSCLFYGYLAVHLKIDVNFDFIGVSSFKGRLESQTPPEITTNFTYDLAGRDIIIVEDIVDSAITLDFLIKYLKKFHPHSVATVVLIDKPDTRKVLFHPDFACFKFYKNPFLIGFGLDVKEKARNLPYLAEFNKALFDKV